MRIETSMRATLATAADEARRLESLGYDRINTPETQHNPFLPLVLAAEHTRRVGLGTSVAIAFPRSPMMVANVAWDLQAYSGGRFAVGLGTQVKGHNVRRFSVDWVAPAPRMREYVLSLRAIWDCWQNGTPLRFEGKHYQFTLMTPMFNPGPIEHPRIPVFLGAVGATMARVAGEVADGVRLHSLWSRRYAEEVILPALTEGARRGGRTLDDFDMMGGGFIGFGRTQAEVEQRREDARRQIAFYASTRTYKAVLDVHGWGNVCTALHEMVEQGRWNDLHTQISDEMVDTFGTFGTYDTIVENLRQRYEGLVDSIGFSSGTPAGDDDRIRELVSQLKAIRSRREVAKAA